MLRIKKQCIVITQNALHVRRMKRICGNSSLLSHSGFVCWVRLVNQENEKCSFLDNFLLEKYIQLVMCEKMLKKCALRFGSCTTTIIERKLEYDDNHPG